MAKLQSLHERITSALALEVAVPSPQLGGPPMAAGGECMDAAVQAAREVRRLASAGLQPILRRLRPSMHGSCCAAKNSMEPDPYRNGIDTHLSMLSCAYAVASVKIPYLPGKSACPTRTRCPYLRTAC